MLRSLIPLVIGATATVLSLAGPTPVGAQEISLGPAMIRQEAALVVKGEIGPPQAAEGADETGKAIFVAAERGAFFLSVDVRGTQGNKNGFGLNEFIPYLTVTYALRPKAGGETVQGQLYPLVGRYGLRYGNNVPVQGPGPYTLTLGVEPPIKVGFGRHTDIETGVGRWWQPFQVEWMVDAKRVVKP
jgi:uncharacterized protein involved in high-affinity Fe2+ transport